MTKLTLKDGSILEVEQGTTIYEVAQKISEGLARVATCGLVNGKVYTTKEFMSLMNTMFDEQLLLNADPDTSGNALPYRQKSSKYMGFVILLLICGGAAIIGCRLFDRRYTR